MIEAVQWRHNEFDSTAVGLSMLTITGWQEGIDLARALSQWVRDRTEEGWNHASVRVPPGNVPVLVALEDAGFRCVDSLVTLAYGARASSPPDPRVGPCHSHDHAAIQALAQGAFESTRYACDPWMPAGAADRVVKSWVSNNLHGRADRTWVARVDGAAVGFLSSLWRPAERVAVIDLIAVDRRCKGMGLGRALTQAMVSHYLGSAQQITVGTQASNAPALALYQSCGFRVVRFDLGFARQLHAAPRAETASSDHRVRETFERG